MKGLVELIAKALVDNPDRVQVSQLDGEQSSIIELKVAPEDMGKIIGKQGRNVQAIRVILGAVGMKLKKRVNIEIVEKP
ncbi:MAG: KH domain-containing protein [Candidatus Aminicenantes bacterium]|nr:KH domain-containing protein [Candidatus Aminicenantes bacterium]